MIDRSEQFGTHQCRRWRAEHFRIHEAIAADLKRGFVERAGAHRDVLDGNRAGNNWLRVTSERLALGPIRSAAMDDDEIKMRAELGANACAREFHQIEIERDTQTAVDRVQKRVERYGIPWPVEISKRDSANEILRKQLAAVARAKDPLWWRRQLRTVAGRRVEGIQREAGRVHRRAGLYVSDWALNRWQIAQKRNALMLDSYDAESDQGDIVPLSECVAASVANPINRRNELMTRMRGWEEVAQAMNLRGALLTLTAPSKYHAMRYAGGINEKFNGCDPRAVMAYLNGVWSRIRAEWHRANIRAFGFRISEPHHDGTPHNHFLLFFAADQIEAAWSIFREHAMAVDGDEPGADKYRCDRVNIDPAKGTAAGYVAKYVSKNIDGFGLGDGDSLQGVASADAHEKNKSQRVRAWASLWGIRQFQQIGAVSVTVYRELRRVEAPLATEPAEVEAARLAADAGDWAKFVELMGGGFVRRAEQLLRPLREPDKKPGRYGEEIKRLIGLALGRVLVGYVEDFCRRWQIVTRLKAWEIVARWKKEKDFCREAAERARIVRPLG